MTYNDNGILIDIKFNKGGSIGKHNNFNEKFWGFDGLHLTIFNV